MYCLHIRLTLGYLLYILRKLWSSLEVAIVDYRNCVRVRVFFATSQILVDQDFFSSPKRNIERVNDIDSSDDTPTLFVDGNCVLSA
jgi:hypothetical protein